MSNEVYRGVNKYIDYNTGEEFLQCGRQYDSTGPARAYATRIRHKTRQFRSTITDTLVDAEFAESWCERAKEWEQV